MEAPKGLRTTKHFSESYPGLKASLATQRDVNCGAELTEPALAPPQAFFMCLREVPSPQLTTLSSSDKHSTVLAAHVLSHLPLRSTLIAPTISLGQHAWRFISLMILDINLETRELIQVVLTQTRYFPIEAPFYHCLTPCENLSTATFDFTLSAAGQCNTSNPKAENIFGVGWGFFI